MAFNKFEAFVKAKYLRPFLDVKVSLQQQKYRLSKRVFQDKLPKTRCLRVLSLRVYHIKDFPKLIGNLKHLRYFDLSHTKIERLPESV